MARMEEIDYFDFVHFVVKVFIFCLASVPYTDPFLKFEKL